MNLNSARVVLGAGLLATFLCVPAMARTAEDPEIADLLIKLLKTGRSVISDNQALINDRNMGQKGFTPDAFVKETIARYKNKTKIDLNDVGRSPRSRLLEHLLQSGREVVQDYQPVINKKGIAFKGVLPAVFARKTGENFYEKTGIKLKLTSLDYRFRGNKPDRFEAEILKMFSEPDYPKGKDFLKYTKVEDQRVLRVMSPEYAKASCLTCHGTPKGERDITGGRKEGWKAGDLGGAISVIMPIGKNRFRVR